ncbi:MAG: hypothetical protein J5913_04035 [Prevotella sp.]|nr:hypothetical protein [Prevotella sp.]MBQ9293938.1 hypothetical protein [Bacteroidaceae bacterium]
MNLLDKINALRVESITPEEIKETLGVSQDEQVEKMMKTVRRLKFKAKAEQGRLKSERAAKLRRIISGRGENSVRLRSRIQSRYPAMQFRNLEQLTDEQLAQIADDLEILEILESENEQG